MQGAELPASVDGHGPPVLLLHGQPGLRQDWELVRERLAPRLRVVTPDRPGYGQAAQLAPLGFAGNAELAAELLERLGAAPAVVAGHSWGAGVALVLALRRPELVRALVLVGGVAPNADFGAVDRMLANPRVGLPLARASFALGAPLLAALVRARGARMPAGRSDWLRATAAALRLRSTARSFVAEQQDLLRELPRYASRLGELAQPATVMTGARDVVVGQADGRALAQLLPQGRFVSVPRAGHLLPQLAPGRVAREIEALAG